MLNNEYLYGKDIYVPEIPNEIIVRRLEALDELLYELMAVSYLTRDTVRIRAVQKAINFWENINEC